MNTPKEFSTILCQVASKIDPLFASNFDPPLWTKYLQ